jgi:glycosyltransferase involved in cell wall biosynthesis
VDGFVFNSEATRGSVETAIQERKPFVIAPPGGDRLGEVTADYAIARASEARPLRLVFVANVARLKGLETVLAALARLSPRDYTLDVVGSLDLEPTHVDEMRRSAARQRLSVVFHGSMGEDQLKKQLMRSQVLVLPSFYEGFGIAYLEGMAHGLPAIGTTAGGIPEVITDGVDGYLIRPGDTATLASHLQRLRSDQTLLVRLSLAALRSYKSRPKWRQSADVILGFLAGMVAAYPSDPA